MGMECTVYNDPSCTIRVHVRHMRSKAPTDTIIPAVWHASVHGSYICPMLPLFKVQRHVQFFYKTSA
jgi:hypothetical protein